MKTNRLKNKILLTLVSVILGVATIVTLYNIIHDKGQNDLRMEEAYQNVRLNYEESIYETVHFYTARAHSNLNSPGVMDAILSRDHDRLYQLILPRWKVISNENSSLVVMQFHNADGTSLLRMHQPDVFGDPIALQRPMVAYIHKHHTLVYGFEEGRQGLALRILVPILNQGTYVGAVEFGLSTPFIIDKIHRHTGYDAFFLVKEKILGTFSHVDRYLAVGEYRAIDVDPELVPLVKLYQSKYDRLQDTIIKYKNQTFAITTVAVNNYLNQPIGAIIFVHAAPDFWEHVLQMVTATGLIALIMMGILGWMISRLYDSISTQMNFQQMYNQTILDAIPSPVIVTDGHQLVAANQTFLAYFHYESVLDFKRDHACVCDYFEEGDTHDYLMPMLNEQRWTDYVSDHPLIDHKVKITIDHKTTIFDVKLSVLRFQEEKRYVVIFTDISSMQSISMTDPLTGIANRLHFTMVYEHAINVAFREKRPLGVIFFDIDYFKHINDKYGHLAGDKVLKHISQVVSKRLRKSDIFARWGGEEFVALLPDTSFEESYQIAETLRQTIEAENFEIAGKITCSFGVAMLEENESADMLLKRADELLYEAKASGRNRVIRQELRETH
ncbi:diguanylate cyclase [Sulfuricurvum sp.]|uniref:diguanylate cyclase n=1 Tax=Sulfuricurvum sp. TaxID=2025608 RepID=UPI002D302996|nr:diguanylate cyclase [Sulfuricurvum sp.]HZF69884.1 diguanylate cyclase [Sulfuricurvum sp.]